MMGEVVLVKEEGAVQEVVKGFGGVGRGGGLRGEGSGL